MAKARRKARTQRSKPSRRARKEKLSGLILDFGAAMAGYPLRIEALRFGAPKDQSNYSAEVWLEASNDLKHWRRWVLPN